jgi:uncharacterized protein (DUF433 family)
LAIIRVRRRGRIGEAIVGKHSWVTETPGVNGGYPVVRGTRTPVRVLVEYYRQTGDFDRVVALVPHLTPGQVRGALDYYILHPTRVDEDLATNDRALAELQGRI